MVRCLCRFLGMTTYFVPEISWQSQFLSYMALSVISLVLWKMYLKKHLVKVVRHFTKVRSVYRNIYILETDIVNGVGKIKVGDALWAVKGPVLLRELVLKLLGTRGLFTCEIVE